MGRPEHEPMNYLTKRGRKLFYLIIRHVRDAGIDSSIDSIELSTLANSFDVYESMAKVCNEEGFIASVTGKNGTFDQIRPQYTIMRNEYANIMKNSMKYGMTPGDREKIFGGMNKKKKKVNPNDGLD